MLVETPYCSRTMMIPQRLRLFETLDLIIVRADGRGFSMMRALG